MDELFASLERGGVLLTGTRRLARERRAGFVAWQRDRGHSVWKSPSILPLDAYVHMLWSDWVAGGGRNAPVLLSNSQEALIWEGAIRGSNAGETLLDVGATARKAMEAWRLIHEWRLPLDGRFGATGDCEAFLGWARAFEAQCAKRNWLDAARLIDFVMARIRGGEIVGPSEAWCEGFDEVAPARREFLESLHTRAAAGTFVSTVVRTRVCATTEDEIRCAAAWSRGVLDQNPSARIGVVIPDLPALRAKAERIFRNELQPGTGPDAEPAFHISLGRPLDDYPMIHAALLAIELASGPMPLSDAGLLLRSPYLGGAVEERERRGRLDARLRKYAAWQVTLDVIREPARGECRGLTRMLGKIPDFAGVRRHVEWAATFDETLSTLGWPGDRTLNSREHQLRQRWNELLSEFAGFDAVAGRLAADEAMSRLRKLAAGSVFQVQDRGAPVQISDPLEIAGMRFDRLWVLGLHDEALPAAADPNPFLPVLMQREYGLPRSSAQRQYESAHAIFERLTNSAAEVVVSYPRAEGDRALAPSPLLMGIATEVSAEPDRWISAIRASAAVETLVDERGPALTEPGVQRGGSRLLGDMAACPFRAFAKYRLGASALEKIEAGLSARDKGSGVHRALQGIWSELKSHAALRAMEPDALEDLVSRHVEAALADLADSTNARVERVRLMGLLIQWLELERRRGPFVAIKLEEKRSVSLGGLELEIRADRVDELPDGGRVILDYKTGVVKPGGWETDRPDDPQVPLYCVASEERIAGAALARLKTADLGFSGITETPLPEFKSYIGKDATPLAEQIAGWRRSLVKLAEDFQSGDARVDPKRGEKTCEFCEIVPLCRIREHADD